MSDPTQPTDPPAPTVTYDTAPDAYLQLPARPYAPGEWEAAAAAALTTEPPEGAPHA